MGSSGSGKSVSTQSFSWGPVGNVTIRTIRYTGLFDQSKDVISAKQPKNRFTESVLSWVNQEYTLEDLRTTDYDTGQTVEFPTFIARFRVSDTQEFESLIDTDGLITDYTAIHKKKLSAVDSAKLIDQVTNKCKDLWNYSRYLWLKYQSVTQKHSINHCGADCIVISLTKDAESSQLMRYIQSKYQPDRIGEVSRRINGKMIVNKITNKPHQVFIRKNSYAELIKKEEVKSEVSEEIIQIIYCWEDIPQLASENYIKSELRKLNVIVQNNLKDLENKEIHKSKSKIL